MDIQAQLIALQHRIEQLERDIERSRGVSNIVAEAQFIAAQQGLDWHKVTRRKTPVDAMRVKLIKRLCALGWSHSKIAMALKISSRTVDRCC